MKKLVLNDVHEQLGGKMVPFAGYFMPVQYKGLLIEHDAVRKSAGIFDVSHMGEIWVKGPNALDFIQTVTTNDASVLTNGKVQYSCFPNGKGGIVDDLLVYRINSETYLLVVNASNVEKDWNWLLKQNTIGAVLYNASDEISEFALQGPRAMDILQKLTNANLSEMPYYTFKKMDVAGVKDMIVSTTGYTGAGGFELYIANEDAKKIWDALMEAGKEFGLMPIGLGARDTLRLEMGYTLYGNDIDDSTSTIEAGLGWVTKFIDNKNFIDKKTLQTQKENGVSRKLVGFEMIDKGIPRQHYEIVDENGNLIGEVTSGTMSPTLKVGIGMGYVKPEFAAIGNNIYIRIREKSLLAKNVKRPFIGSQVNA